MSEIARLCALRRAELKRVEQERPIVDALLDKVESGSRTEKLRAVKELEAGYIPTGNLDSATSGDFMSDLEDIFS